MTDPKVILWCKQGLEQGHAQLYKDCAPYVYSHVKRYIWDAAFRKDMMQEIFAKVFSNIKSFDAQKGTFNSWIRKIAVNECLKHIRKSRPLFVAKGIEASPEMIDESPLPTELKRKDVEVILAEMPSGYKLVFMLSVMDGYTHKEISKELNITEETSRSQLTRAKKWARRYLLSRIQKDLYGLL
ncbi:MAG: sigma-70 family RNA polymerase sigma factor [Bacteroidota bacterium]